MFTRRIALISTLLLAVTACAVTRSGGESAAPADVVVVGSLPPTLPTLAPGEGFTTVPRTTVVLAPEQLIGARVTGNRIIMIGDSVLASTAKRHSGEMCEALVPLDWAVEVDAETARFIEFGNEVLGARLNAGWDAALVFLGNNYDVSNPGKYRSQLTRIVERLAPRPTILVTVSEYRREQVDVNAMIFEVAAQFPANVIVLDWAAITADHPNYTRDDRLHLSPTGRAALAQHVADVLGRAPVAPGDCLGTNFFDDSAGSVDGSTTTTSTGGGPTIPTTPLTTAPPTTDQPGTDPPTSGGGLTVPATID